MLFLLTAFNGKSAIIESRGYSLDTSTNIITGGGLEWLNWNETIELSVANVYDSSQFNGWRLATSNEMRTLLNTFFGPVDTNSSVKQRVDGDYGSAFGEEFFSLFTGYRDNFCGTSRNGCLTNPQNRTLTIYGKEDSLRTLFIREDYDWGNDTTGFADVKGYLEIYTGPATTNSMLHNTGIALVRGVGSLPSQSTGSVSVSEPNELLFFSVFLLIVLRFKSARDK